MRLICWNVRNGGGRRIHAQVHALASRRPDIVALQEITSNRVADFRRLLEQSGLRHVVDSFKLVKALTQLKGPRKYGQLIASRWSIRALRPSFDVPWRERILSGNLETPYGPIEIHVLRTSNLSDHSAIEVCFKPQRPKSG